ncbi:hypothetical protein [Falsiroseomonas sp.]|uniref:hypothetical protein n=1 Tax=Falsiroseomonas sp. TaxID=2870721 RepID=UPI0034A4EAC8
MLAIFLSFRVAGAAAARIAVAARQARFGQCDELESVARPWAMRWWRIQDRLNWRCMLRPDVGTSIRAMSLAETHAASARSWEPPRIAGSCAE